MKKFILLLMLFSFIENIVAQNVASRFNNVIGFDGSKIVSFDKSINTGFEDTE